MLAGLALRHCCHSVNIFQRLCWCNKRLWGMDTSKLSHLSLLGVWNQNKTCKKIIQIKTAPWCKNNRLMCSPKERWIKVKHSKISTTWLFAIDYHSPWCSILKRKILNGKELSAWFSIYFLPHTNWCITMDGAVWKHTLTTPQTPTAT